MHTQLVLPLDTAPACSFATFSVNAGNAEVFASLRAFVTGELDEQQVFLCGERGAGKSHLLHAACHEAADRGYRAAYLNGEWLSDPASMEALEQFYLVCLDDLQKLDPSAEIALFHCINRCRASGTHLLLAADRVPAALGLRLPDLFTRLSWGPLYQLSQLTESELRLALVGEFQHRSMLVAADVIDYLLRRVPREMRSLKQLVVALDEASLSSRRRVTIPLVRQVLAQRDD